VDDADQTRTPMKKIIFLILALFALVACKQVEDKKTENGMAGMKADSVKSCCVAKDGVFLHISSGYDNPHKVLMALKMAVMMSMDKDVVVYFDIKGVDLVLKTSKEMKFKDFPTLHELLDQLAEKKVIVMACPTCLKVAGYKPEDLRPGIIIAEKDKFFNFTKGRIVTLDY
jgi:predicted peroxiredoxin